MFGKSLIFFLLGCAVASAIPTQRNAKPAQLENVANYLNIFLQETNNRLQKGFLTTIQPFEKIHSSLIEASNNVDKGSLEKIKKLSSIYKTIIRNGLESFKKVRDAVGKLVNRIQESTSDGILADDMDVFVETLNEIQQYSIKGTDAAVDGLTQILLQWKNHVDGFLKNDQIDSDQSEQNNNNSGLLSNSAGKVSPIKLTNPGELWNNIAGAVGINKIFPKIPLPKLPVLDKNMFEKIGQKVGGHIGGQVDKFTNTVGGILNNAIGIIGK